MIGLFSSVVSVDGPALLVTFGKPVNVVGRTKVVVGRVGRTNVVSSVVAGAEEAVYC